MTTQRSFKNYKDIRVGDITNRGVILECTMLRCVNNGIFMAKQSGYIITLDRHVFPDYPEKICASKIEINYTKLKRDLNRVLTGKYNPNPKKSICRDLMNFWKCSADKVISLLSNTDYINEQLIKLSKMEKSIILKPVSESFGI